MTLDVNVNSPVFKAMVDDANKEIRRVLLEVYNGNFDGGEITIKLKLDIRKVTNKKDFMKSLKRLNIQERDL